MNANQADSPHEISSEDLPLILLSGDNARTAGNLHRALIDQGFRVQFAPAYTQLESLWQRHCQPNACSMVLLEVSGAHGVEAAVDAALQLKRLNPYQFVGYLADPALRTSGLIGDVIFPRSAEQLAKALRNHFRDEA
jgi:hypothetical protein